MLNADCGGIVLSDYPLHLEWYGEDPFVGAPPCRWYRDSTVSVTLSCVGTSQKWDCVIVVLSWLTYFTWHNDLRVHPFCNESELPSFSWLNNIPLYSFVAQLVNLPAVWETWVQSLALEDSLEKERLLTPVFWHGEFHGLYSLWDHKEWDRTEWLLLHFMWIFAHLFIYCWAFGLFLPLCYRE